MNPLFATVLLLAGAAPAEIPYPGALGRASVVQSPMAEEIPGSLILGNGDLNGILWIHRGRLRFSIAKNDACDGRLDTAKDPDLVRIDIKDHKYNVPVPTLPVFPCGEVSWWSSDEEKAVFARTIQTVRTTGYNSVMLLAGTRARLSLPGTHEWIAREFRRRQMPTAT